MVFELIAVLLVRTAAFGWLNHVVFRLPHTIGLLIMGLVASLVLIGLEFLVPQITLYESVEDLLRRIDFQNAVLNGMLAFLLFAGALHVDLALRRHSWSVGMMGTMGVLISTAVVGLGLWCLSGLLGLDIPFTSALVFGALINPLSGLRILSRRPFCLRGLLSRLFLF